MNTQRPWPSAWLAEELRRLNGEFMRDAIDPFVHGRDCWPNRQYDRFAEELVDADSHGVSAISIDDPAFDELMRSGKRFNWAVRLDGSIWISPSIIATDDGPVRISHAILVENCRDVLAAGEGVAPKYLSNTTGHYKNETFVVAPVKRAFADIGILFQR